IEAAPAHGALAATRRAALLSAAQGLSSRVADWLAIDPGEARDVPGLLAARTLLRLPAGPPGPDGPGGRGGGGAEGAGDAGAGARAAGRGDALALASEAVVSWPERVETWIAAVRASGRAGPSVELREKALRTLQLFDRGPVAPAVAARLLDGGATALDALPA